jgi:hypothetical protein
MCKLNIFIVCMLMVLLAACSKDKETATLPDASVSFALPVGKDSLQMSLPVTANIPVVFDIKAALSGTASLSDHRISFAIETTKITEYRARYGEGRLLPTTSYLFYKANAVIPAGSSISDAAQLNIGLQTKLRGRTTYVLPVVIKSVDGKVEGPGTSRVIYYVFKTGPATTISNDSWTVTASSQNGSQVAANAIDDYAATYWLSNITQIMPQSLTIDFHDEWSFFGVKYSFPAILSYPTAGGYPTSIRIETSLNGTTWVDRGVFAGNIVNNAQTLNTGQVTARYLRFTVLSVVNYASYNAVFISDIALIP